MKLISFASVALLGSILALPVMAQQDPMQGDYQGYDYKYGPNTGTGKSTTEANQHFFNNLNTPGFILMTPEERRAYHIKMWNAKTLEECKVIQSEHRTSMEKRAQELGVPLRTPRRDGCEEMKERGMFK